MSKEIFLERRSVNFFDSSRELDTDTLNNILELGATAPSAFNLQPWRIIAVSSEEEKEKLLPLAWNQPKIKEAPVTLIIIADRAGFEADHPIWNPIEEAAGKETADILKDMAGNLYGASEEMKIKFAETNGSLLAMSIMYAAKTFGVDSHAMSGLDYKAVKEAYNLNDTEEVVMLVSLGYHDKSKELHPRGFRKSGKDLVTIM